MGNSNVLLKLVPNPDNDTNGYYIPFMLQETTS